MHAITNSSFFMRLVGSARLFGAADPGERDSWLPLLGPPWGGRPGFGGFGKTRISGVGGGGSKPEGSRGAFDREGPVACDGRT